VLPRYHCPYIRAQHQHRDDRQGVQAHAWRRVSLIPHDMHGLVRSSSRVIRYDQFRYGSVIITGGRGWLRNRNNWRVVHLRLKFFAKNLGNLQICNQSANINININYPLTLRPTTHTNNPRPLSIFNRLLTNAPYIPPYQKKACETWSTRLEMLFKT
jgi:hypothetical protein